MEQNANYQNAEFVEHTINYHWSAPYLLNPNHKVTINLIGIGGTGSLVLTKLAMLNVALMKLGHPGLFVQAWDPDIVTNANIGRQLFYDSDMGKYKASVLINRVNNSFGTDWTAINKVADKSAFEQQANIYITCVDNIASRKQFNTYLNQTLNFVKKDHPEWLKPFYWIDAGNVRSSGQVVIGTIGKIPQPKGNEKYETLKNLFELFPELKKMKEDNNHPSCSLAEALENQDLFINSFMADWVAHMLWQLFRYARTKYNGVFINIENFETNPIYL